MVKQICRNCGRNKEEHLKIRGGQMQNYPNYLKNKIFLFCGEGDSKFKLNSEKVKNIDSQKKHNTIVLNNSQGNPKKVVEAAYESFQ